MATHTYHDALDGYDERQILHEGCSECEYRGKHLDEALAHMDKETFARAWKRAYDWRAAKGDHNAVGPLSAAEIKLLDTLWGIQVALERFGVELNGEVPHA